MNRAGGAHGEQGRELSRVDGTEAVGGGADAQKRVMRGVTVERGQQRQVLVAGDREAALLGLGWLADASCAVERRQ